MMFKSFDKTLFQNLWKTNPPADHYIILVHLTEFDILTVYSKCLAFESDDTVLAVKEFGAVKGP